ncbi:MAG: ribbon-helix-helix domain-containing protein [Proteobacteria bacterium]|nr:ribbon-helix-helix domain-containing protein [Pseudomonadota bacterium]MDA1059134.1 ribbon-helix-helix domain-containing protein [Pseudomonadota bacterium]
MAKRSVIVAGHRTSVSLESEFWDELALLAKARGVSLNALVAEVDETRTGNLSSALRLFVLRSVKTETANDPRAGG